MQKDVEWIERQKRQIEDVTRVEDMFERMSDVEAAEHARDAEENVTKEREQSRAHRDSTVVKTAAIASEQALSALKKRPSLSGQQTPRPKGERAK